MGMVCQGWFHAQHKKKVHAIYVGPLVTPTLHCPGVSSQARVDEAPSVGG